MRKSLIIVTSFVLGVATTAIAAAVYDANIQSRADAMLATIRSNASTLSPADTPAYYSLVRSNIQSLIAVLNTVDSALVKTIAVAPVSPVSGSNPTTTPVTASGANIKPSGTLELGQNGKYTSVSSRYTVDSTKWDITAKWDIQNAEGCWLSPGYVKSGVAYSTKTNGGDFLASKWTEIIPLLAPDGGKFYDLSLVCGVRAKWWANSYSQPTRWILIDTVAGVGNTNTVATVSKVDLFCSGNGWPASIDVYGDNLTQMSIAIEYQNGTKWSTDVRYDSNIGRVYRGQLVENIKTLTLVEAGQKTLTTANMSSCKANPYPAKPEITSVKYDPATKTVVVQTKNTISTDYVDVTIGNSSNSFFWEKDGKGQYRATLSDPYYKSIIVDLAAGNAEFSVYGSFEPNYWRNSVRYTRYPLSKTDMTSILPMPALSMSRTCNGTPCATIKPGDTYAANYTTTDATSISYKCTGPVGSSQIGNEVSLPLQLSGNTSSYESLVTGGWIVGSYTCTYTIVGPGGTISPVESFSISN